MLDALASQDVREDELAVAVRLDMDAEGRFGETWLVLDRTAQTLYRIASADLSVGKNFTGEIDFLRIAHSSLAESHTTIDELYAWEFSGPFK